MEYPRLGHSGLRVSELIYGNWLTHASQVEAGQAEACVRAALDAGITTFDTADTSVWQPWSLHRPALCRQILLQYPLFELIKSD